MNPIICIPRIDKGTVSGSSYDQKDFSVIMGRKLSLKWNHIINVLLQATTLLQGTFIFGEDRILYLSSAILFPIRFKLTVMNSNRDSFQFLENWPLFFAV